MKTIEIYEQTYLYLQKNAIPYIEQPGDTIERLLGLSKIQIESKNVLNDQIRIPLQNGGNIKEKKKPMARLDKLITAKILQNGQALTLQDDSGHLHSEYKATISNISNNKLFWEGELYSMSGLAGLMLKRLGYRADVARGPKYWTTEDGRTVKELWEEYLNK